MVSPLPGASYTNIVADNSGFIFCVFKFSRGSFLTSSLIATLAISLTIPMSMVADILFKNVSYSTLFYLGTIPMIISFFAVNFLAHYENWDPVMDFFRKIAKDCCPTRSYHRYGIFMD